MIRNLRPFVVLLSATLLALASSGHAQQPLLVGGLPSIASSEAGFSAESLTAIGVLIKSAVDNREIAGGSALVVRRGKIAHLAIAGMQDVEAKVTLNANTIFRIASMTKPVTSVAAMMLVEDGKLRLDDPIA